MANSCPGPSVLVTDGSYKHAVGVTRSLGLKHYRVGVVSQVRFAPGFYSRHTWKHEKIRHPGEDSSGFIADLLCQGRLWQTEVVVPVGFASCEAVARQRPLLTDAGMASVGPSFEEFRRCADKWQIVQIAKQAGVQAPETALLADLDDARKFVRIQGASVLKDRFESRGTGVSYVEDSSPWPALEGAVEPSERIIQARIRGVGCGYMALAHHGKVVREFAHRRLRELPISGGPATAAVSSHDDTLLKAGRRLIEAVRWHGVAMVEFRSNATGHYLIEFNPKFWGSLELALACGADFPDDYCRMALGEDLRSRKLPSYREGVRFWWPWRGDLRRLLHQPGASWDVLKDLVSPRAQSNCSWLDPLPNLVEMMGELTHPFRHHGS